MQDLNLQYSWSQTKRPTKLAQWELLKKSRISLNLLLRTSGETGRHGGLQILITTCEILLTKVGYCNEIQ